MSALILQNVTRCYKDLNSPALALDLLKISQGEHVAITGASGSGKTTLINLLTGLERPTTGKIIWDTQDIATLSPLACDAWRAQNVGLMMQEFHLYPGLSALDNVLLPASFKYWRLPQVLRHRAHELLEKVGLSSNLRKIDCFSRGEMQRVAVARALLNQPKIIIADEPTASLDQKSGEEVISLMLALATEQKSSLLIVTHDQRLVTRMQRCLAFDAGQLISDELIS